MIKAKKSLFAALFAVMMVVAFIPAMAFAADASGDQGESPAGAAVKQWAADYSTVTDVNGVTFKTERTFDAETGIITATPLDNESGVVGVPATPAPDAVAHYYDLEGATFVYGDAAKPVALDGTKWTQAAYASTLAGKNPAIKLVEPAYVKDYDAKTAKFAVVNGFENWTLTFAPFEYTAGLEADQTITYSVTTAPAEGVVIDGVNNNDLMGKVADAKITVNGQAKTPDTANFYFDAVGNDALNTSGQVATLYDGDAHSIVADAVPGWTVAYAVYNTSTGKYDSVSAVSLTDVQDKALKVKATFSKEKEADVVKYFDANLVAPINGATIGFDQDASLVDDGYVYRVAGTEYNAADYIVVTANVIPTKDITDPDQKAFVKALNAAAQKAIAKNEAQLKEYFNALYEVEATTSKEDGSYVKLNITNKELTTAEEEAIAKQYAALIANVGEPDVDVEGASAWVYFNNGVIDYEVEFTNTPTAMTYKAKKLKKKAASFTVTAVANNGATVKYKLINAPQKITIDKATGKVTLKKGLKKGTYKIQVKAYVPTNVAVENAINTFEYQTIKIKVKK